MLLCRIESLSQIQSTYMQVLEQALQRIRPAVAAARCYSSAAKEVTSPLLVLWLSNLTQLPLQLIVGQSCLCLCLSGQVAPFPFIVDYIGSTELCYYSP